MKFVTDEAEMDDGDKESSEEVRLSAFQNSFQMFFSVKAKALCGFVQFLDL